MLNLIGLGLADEYDMSLRGLEEAKKADKVYFESYTGRWLGSIENLQRLLGKEQVFVLRRADMEENSGKIIDEAKGKRIAILVQGDPMVATTHSSLLVEARKAGIETNIIHGSSIFSSVSETGLHVYKFGATVTIPFLEKTGGTLPKSVYDSIGDNRKRGLHTLCLLDVGADAKTFMTPAQGAATIMSMERQFGEGVIGQSQKVVALCRSGRDPRLFYGEIEGIESEETPAVLVVPGKLHFSEEEFLESFRDQPPAKRI